MTWEEIQRRRWTRCFPADYGVEVALDSADVADLCKGHAKGGALCDDRSGRGHADLPQRGAGLPERADGYRLFRVRSWLQILCACAPDRLTVMGKSNTFRRINDYQFDGDDLLYVPKGATPERW